MSEFYYSTLAEEEAALLDPSGKVDDMIFMSCKERLRRTLDKLKRCERLLHLKQTQPYTSPPLTSRPLSQFAKFKRYLERLMAKPRIVTHLKTLSRSELLNTASSAGFPTHATGLVDFVSKYNVRRSRRRRCRSRSGRFKRCRRRARSRSKKRRSRSRRSRRRRH